VQITAEGMYPPGSSIYVTSHKLLAAIGANTQAEARSNEAEGDAPWIDSILL
jgi:hypothetical protein